MNVLNLRGGPMAGEIEEYLDRFDAVEHLVARIHLLAKKISDVADLLADDPGNAFAQIPEDWPSYQQIRELLQEYTDRNAELRGYWNAVPERIRKEMTHKRPEGVGQTRMRIPD